MSPQIEQLRNECIEQFWNLRYVPTWKDFSRNIYLTLDSSQSNSFLEKLINDECTGLDELNKNYIEKKYYLIFSIEKINTYKRNEKEYNASDNLCLYIGIKTVHAEHISEILQSDPKTVFEPLIFAEIPYKEYYTWEAKLSKISYKHMVLGQMRVSDSIDYWCDIEKYWVEIFQQRHDEKIAFMKEIAWIST